MERIDPAHQNDGEDIPERINDALDPRSISPADIESDDYDGTQSVEEYLRNPKRRTSQPAAPPWTVIVRTVGGCFATTKPSSVRSRCCPGNNVPQIHTEGFGR
jgi:hypothetical protein